jgi:hypothetical protein
MLEAKTFQILKQSNIPIRINLLLLLSEEIKFVLSDVGLQDYSSDIMSNIYASINYYWAVEKLEENFG